MAEQPSRSSYVDFANWNFIFGVCMLCCCNTSDTFIYKRKNKIPELNADDQGLASILDWLASTTFHVGRRSDVSSG